MTAWRQEGAALRDALAGAAAAARGNRGRGKDPVLGGVLRAHCRGARGALSEGPRARQRGADVEASRLDLSVRKTRTGVEEVEEGAGDARRRRDGGRTGTRQTG